jgi:hypothetical protein
MKEGRREKRRDVVTPQRGPTYFSESVRKGNGTLLCRISTTSVSTAEGAIQVAGGPNGAVFNDAITPLFAVTSLSIWARKDKYKAQYLITYGAVEESYEEVRNEEFAKKLWETSDGISCSISCPRRFSYETIRVYYPFMG